MANTYTQIHIQAIFAVQHRRCLIQDEWKNELYNYITGVIQNHNHRVLAINGMPDHIHIFFGMRPKQSLSELMQMVKGSSSHWINQKGFLRQAFSWQRGYGAFSYSKSEVPRVCRYIAKQEEHHKKKSFIQEYHDFLKAFEVDYDKRFIFNPVI